jgi:hypothetical protein
MDIDVSSRAKIQRQLEWLPGTYTLLAMISIVLGMWSPQQSINITLELLERQILSLTLDQ